LRFSLAILTSNALNRCLALVAVALLLGGCVSLPPGSSYPKEASVAYAQPENTAFGRQFAAPAAAHPGESGFRLLAAGVDGFLTRAQMVNSAEKTIDMQYFIFRADDTGRLLTEAVLRAADRGVRVRVLVDDGETVAGDEQLVALDAHPQIEVRSFNPLLYRGHHKFFRALEYVLNSSRLDYRMHNKLVVIDNAIALVGGRNIGDQYFQIDPDSQMADDDVFAAGPVVRALSGSFDEFWNSALAIPVRALGEAETSDAALATYREILDSHRRQLKADGVAYANRVTSGEPLAGMLAGRLPLTWAHAQLIYDSPEKRRVEKGEMVGKLMHRPVAAAVAATQSELLMVTPYFIPGDEGMQLFRDLRQRDVRIRILTNSLESNTVLVAQAGYMNYRRPLLAEGVDIHEIRSLLGNTRGSGQTAAISRFGNFSLHAKMFIFDRRKLFIGSMNFDQRSMHLNTEIGLLIDSPELAQQLAARFEAMISPPNSYQLLMLPHGDGQAPQLTWRTEENGRMIDYEEEPSRGFGQRFKVKLLSLLPLDDEL
jgi:putative cardiolipin synthase